MKFLSDKTGKIYNSIKECTEAEKEFEIAEQEKKVAEEKKASERKTDAINVEDIYKKYSEAQKQADTLYKDFIKAKKEFINKYGAFHLSDSDGDVKVTTVSDFASDVLYPMFNIVSSLLD